MNSFVVFFAILAVANAGLLAPSAKILQGPSSKTTVVGPDGSAISAVAPGGQIVHEESVGVVAHAAPVVAHAAPAIIAHSAPVLAAPVAVAPVAPHTLRLAPALPSRLAGLPVAQAVVPAGHGLEGQYVHDHSELLYDDGTYKPHVYGF